MYVVRNVFQAKPGKAKDLVQKFKKAAPHMEKLGIPIRVMTDTVSGFWNVVIESQVEDLASYLDGVSTRMGSSEIAAALDGYMELVVSGRREVFKVE